LYLLHRQTYHRAKLTSSCRTN